MVEEDIIEERPLVRRERLVRRWRRDDDLRRDDLRRDDLRRDEIRRDDLRRDDLRRDDLRRDELRRREIEDEDDAYPIRRGPGLWGLIGIILVLIGLMTMVSAFFGYGLESAYGYSDAPSQDAYVFATGEAAARRTMVFIGGGFLTTIGVITTVMARIAASLVWDDRPGRRL